MPLTDRFTRDGLSLCSAPSLCHVAAGEAATVLKRNASLRLEVVSGEMVVFAGIFVLDYH